MGTGNEPQRNHPGQHAQTPADQKSGKGSGRGNPPASVPGNDPQRFSDKVNDGRQPDLGTKGQPSAGK